MQIYILKMYVFQVVASDALLFTEKFVVCCVSFPGSRANLNGSVPIRRASLIGTFWITKTYSLRK